MSDLVAGVRDLEKDSVAGSSALPKHRTLSAWALGALSHCGELQQTNLGGEYFRQDNTTTVQKLVEEKGSARHISFVRMLIFKCCAGSLAFI